VKRAREERNREKQKNNHKTSKKMTISTYLSIIILNVNAPIKRQGDRMDKKARPTSMLPTTHSFQT